MLENPLQNLMHQTSMKAKRRANSEAFWSVHNYPPSIQEAIWHQQATRAGQVLCPTQPEEDIPQICHCCGKYIKR